MKLEKLVVKNIGPYHGTTQFDLSSGLVVFQGANFSGKSTLARALYFALCGKTLPASLKTPTMTHKGESSGTVGLFFEHEQKHFRIYRSTKADLRIEQLAGENWHLRSESDCREVLALNPQQLRVGCFLHEDELGEFLVQPPASRRELLNQLLGVERLLKAQELFIQVRRLAKRREKNVLGLQQSLRVDTSSDRSAELQETRRRMEGLTARLQEVQRHPATPESDQRLRQSLDQAKCEAQNRLKKWQSQFDEIRRGFHNIEELDEILRRGKEQLANTEAAKQEAHQNTQRRMMLANDLRQIEATLEELQGLRGKSTCPTCHQSLTPALIETLAQDYQARRATTLNELQQAERQEKSAQETVQLLEELARKQLELQQRQAHWREVETEVTAAQNEIGTWEVKLAALAPLSAAEGDLAALQQELASLQKRLAELEQQQMLHEQRRQDILSANRQVETATRHRVLSEWAADAVTATVQAAVGISLKKAEKEITSCLQDFGLFRSHPQTVELEKSQLMPDLDGRALLTLSGSEKTILYLSMKIALSRLLPGADFLVLDEPTQHLDDTRRDRLHEYILKLVPAKQVILFTNNRNFAELFTEAKRIDL